MLPCFLLWKIEMRKQIAIAELAYMQAQQAGARARILRRPQVQEATGLCRSAIYALMSKGEFPAAIPLTAKAVGWLESSVQAWINDKVAASAAAAAD